LNWRRVWIQLLFRHELIREIDKGDFKQALKFHAAYLEKVPPGNLKANAYSSLAAIDWKLNEHRNAIFDDDIIRVSLKKGLNKVLIKVCNRLGDWGFYFRVTDELLYYNSSQWMIRRNG